MMNYTEFMKPYRHKEVLNFIKIFIHKYSCDTKAVIDLFTTDMCYYFAVMLKERFIDYDPVIMYYEVGGHFAVKIFDRIYDITGDITFKNLPFETFEENPEFARGTPRGDNAFNRYILK